MISQAAHDENGDNDDTEGNNSDSQQTMTPISTTTQPASSIRRTVAKRASTSPISSFHGTAKKRVRRKKWVYAEHQMNLLLFSVLLLLCISVFFFIDFLGLSILAGQFCL